MQCFRLTGTILVNLERIKEIFNNDGIIIFSFSKTKIAF